MTTTDQTIDGTKTFNNTINASITGNAGTVTNGIYTTSSVTDLSDISSSGSGQIITSAERTKLTNIEENADVTDTTNVKNAGAVMTTTDQTIDGTKTFNNTINASITGNAGTVTKFITGSVTDLSDISSSGVVKQLLVLKELNLQILKKMLMLQIQLMLKMLVLLYYY